MGVEEPENAGPETQSKKAAKKAAKEAVKASKVREYCSRSVDQIIGQNLFTFRKPKIRPLLRLQSTHPQSQTTP